MNFVFLYSRLYILLLIVNVVFTYTPLSTQTSPFILQSLGQSDGLSNTFGMHFGLDEDGFFWSSSRDGLNRYDGREVKVFRPQFNGKSIDPNITSDVFQDGKGNRWFTSNTALHCIIEHTDSVQTWQLSPGGHSYHYAFHLENDSLLWLTTAGQLYRINLFNPIANLKPIHQYNAYLTYAVESQSGQVAQLISPLAGQKGFEVLSYTDFPDFRKDSVLLNNEILGQKTIGGPFIHITSPTSYWVPSSVGLIHLNPQSPPEQWQVYTHKASRNTRGYHDITPWKDQYFWIASRDEGLLLFDHKKPGFIEQNTLFYSDNQFLELSSIKKLHIDRHDNLWLSINDKGFFHANLDHIKFDQLLPRTLLAQKEQFQVTGLTEDAKGNILCHVQNDNEGLWLFNPTNPYQSYPVHLTKPSNEKDSPFAIKYIYTDWSDNLWILADNEIWIWSRGSKFPRLVFTGEHEFYEVIQVNDDAYLLLDDRHLYVVFKKGSFPEYFFPNELASDVYLPTQLFYDPGSQLAFISQDDNLLRVFDVGNDFIEKDTVKNVGIVNGFYPCHKSDSIWLATSVGLFLYNPQNNKAFKPESHNVQNKAFTNVIEDSLGHVWLSSYWGIYLYQQEEKKFYHFTQNDGLLTMQYTENSGLYSKSGNIYFGGNKGVTVINPHKFKLDDRSPSIELVEVTINGEHANSEDFINPDEFLSLRYNRNNLQFRFVTLEFSDPKNNILQYVLIKNGVDTVQIGHGHNIFLNTLSPGKYQLNLLAINSNQIKSLNPQSYTFKVRRPWFGTIWAIIIYIIAFLSIVYAIYQYDLKRRIAIKERKQQQELERFKNKLYANITHEFKTPLAVIKGVGEQIDTHQQAKQYVQKEISIILRNAHQLQQLVEQMLDLSKIDAGVMRLNLIQGDITTYLKTQLEMFVTLAHAKQVQLHMLHPTEGVIMDFDTEKMRQIASNLLSNAIKFTPAEGHIYLQYSLQQLEGQQYFRLQVADTGIGIDKEKLDKIFDRYYQVDNSLSRGYEGTGIGLSLVKELVQLKGGKIEVHSTKGKGTTFTADFPITNNAPFLSPERIITPNIKPSYHLKEMPSPASLATTKEDTPLILIIEDNDDYRQLLASYFQAFYQVVEATDGEDGKLKAFQYLPDIILTDVMMPKIDGYELCAILKQDSRTNHIPIIMLTAKGDIDSKLFGLRRGADDYLPKPVNAEELVVRSQNLMAIRQILYDKASIVETLKNFKRERSAEEDAFIQQFIDIILSNIDDPDLKIPFLLQKMRCSKSLLNKRVKEVCGTTPARFIRTIRLTKAKEIIQQAGPAVTLKQVAFSVGFIDYPHFSASYKEEFGFTPAETLKHL